MTMTTDHDHVDVEHVGGPYDGQYQRVPLDADGQPPAVYLLNDFGLYDPSIDPLLGVQTGITVRFYELDMVMGERGPRHVYRYNGEDTQAPRQDTTHEDRMRDFGYGDDQQAA